MPAKSTAKAAADPSASAPLPDSALVPVQQRADGWTPQRQRTFIETLADTGSVTAAAQSVGMSTVSAYKLRRRADARAFDAAWEAALERAMQRLLPAAIDRALNGTLRERWYHGELVGEERVYSDRLLVALLNNGSAMLGAGRARRAYAENWAEGMAALEAGASAPPEPPYQLFPMAAGLATDCPPPKDYRGAAIGAPGHPGYSRYLTSEEQRALTRRQRRAAAAQEVERRRFFDLDGAG